ncbi:insulinase family protein [Pseudoalteromonas sp. SG45-5]|uniref:insulinase family protein n=1 Tax=unclassified Pseudoalteromonas TaxID=194690 RepID=UPI0015FBAB96|nr:MULTISPECIES: insulinase family protein [unclassified Pseudoalteromonas]MBB1386671.1 insulinase family protein [Pseudoalteromonas sp. SG45-5]MBB1394714.1 insulinase family protein [Pseudoalteromonas sp. SG44-4]MBB1447628.1 insulinase family protein [Pseudoalteromonas sp. SG41-6]
MKKIIGFSAIALAVLSGCSNTSPISQAPQAALLSDTLVVSPNDNRQYKTLKLANDIEVILVSDPSAEKSAASLSVGVGLLHDPMSQQGMAHYLEHMLFLGTERYPDTKGYSDFMTKNGGAHNAYTWLDITNYMFKVNNDAFDEGLDRFADFFKTPKLYPEYTDKEKNAVNAEWSMRREMDFFGQFKLARKMMGEHPANRFLIGNLETLGDKEGGSLHKETVDFYNKYYSANIMKVALISNLTISEMEQKAQKYFADIENKNIDKPTVTTKLDFDNAGGKRVFYAPNEDVKQLQLDFTIANNNSEFAVKPNRFVAYLLSNEMPGSPAQLLRDKGWVSQLSASSTPNQYGNYGSLNVNVELTDEGMKNREMIVATIMQYIDLIKREGVDSKYFNEIRTSLSNQFKFLEKGDEFNYVSALTQSMQDYPLNHAINAPYHYAKFDANAVNKVLEQLNADTLRIWYISQQEETDSKLHFYDGKYRISDIGEQEIASWKKPSEFKLVLPSVNNLLPESFAIKTHAFKEQKHPELAYDKNGVKVWRQASQKFAEQPKGLVEVYINTESGLSDIKAEVLYSVWADLYNIQQSQLSTEAAVAGMSVSLVPSNGLVLSMSGFTDKQNVLLKQALSGLNSDITAQAFNQAIDRFKRDLLNEQKQFPYAQAFGEYSKLIRTGSFDTDELIKTADSLTLTDFNELKQSTLANNDLRVFSYGNYNQQDIDAIAGELAAVLPNNHKHTDFVRSKAWLPQLGEALVLQKDIDVADVAVVDMTINPTPGYKQKAQAAILQGHFSTIAFDKMRTEEQLAYAVGALARPIEEYSAIGLFIQTPVKGPKEIQARFDKFKKEYAVELDNMTEETFAQLKNATLVSLKEQPKNLSDEMGPLISDWYRENFNFDSKQKLINEVEKVTLADIKDYYKQTMLNPNAARLNVQLRGAKFIESDFANLPNQTKIITLDAYYNGIKLQK